MYSIQGEAALQLAKQVAVIPSEASNLPFEKTQEFRGSADSAWHNGIAPSLPPLHFPKQPAEAID